MQQTSSDLFLFPKLKIYLNGKIFEDVEGINKNTTAKLQIKWKDVIFMAIRRMRNSTELVYWMVRGLFWRKTMFHFLSICVLGNTISIHILYNIPRILKKKLTFNTLFISLGKYSLLTPRILKKNEHCNHYLSLY